MSSVKPSWCWVDNFLPVTVDDSNVADIVLQQKGYEAVIDSTHSMQMVSCITYPELLAYTKNPEQHKCFQSAGTQVLVAVTPTGF